MLLLAHVKLLRISRKKKKQTKMNKQTLKKESAYLWTIESDFSLFLQYSEYNSSIRCSYKPESIRESFTF